MIHLVLRANQIAGVYFLFLRRHLVYIGQSVCCLRRLGQHRDRGMVFDEVMIIEGADEDISDLETYYVTMLKPPRNKYKRQMAYPRLQKLAEDHRLFPIPDGYEVGEPPDEV